MNTVRKRRRTADAKIVTLILSDPANRCGGIKLKRRDHRLQIYAEIVIHRYLEVQRVITSLKPGSRTNFHVSHLEKRHNFN